MKQSYHSGVLIAYRMKVLPNELQLLIPRSTLKNWNNREVTKLVGYNWCGLNEHRLETLQAIAESERLLQINRGIVRALAVFRKIIVASKYPSESIRKFQQEVVSAVTHLQASIGKKKALKIFFLTSQRFYQWKQTISCRYSMIGWCRKKHPQQLAEKEWKAIMDYCKDERWLHWPLVSVYYQMMHEGKAFLHKSTFYKYVSKLNLKRVAPKSRRKNHEQGIRATRPFEILHADVMQFRPLDHTRVFIYLVQDNFSRNILSQKVSLEYKASIALENLRNAINHFHLGKKPLTLISDDGSENAGELKQFVEESPCIRHLIAQKDIVQSNSMIECANKKIKYDFLFRRDIADYEQTVKYVEQAVNDYNLRPHDVLCGLSPTEVIKGAIPDANALKSKIQLARKERILQNHLANCCEEKQS